jgi:hypothetical protein
MTWRWTHLEFLQIRRERWEATFDATGEKRSSCARGEVVDVHRRSFVGVRRSSVFVVEVRESKQERKKQKPQTRKRGKSRVERSGRGEDGVSRGKERQRDGREKTTNV